MADFWEKDAVASPSAPAANDFWSKDEEFWKRDESPASWWSTIKAIPRTGLGQTQESVGGIVQAVGDVAGSKAIAEAGAGIAESGTLNVEEANPGNLSYWKRAVLSGGASALQMAPLIASTVATGGLAAPLAAAGGLAGGQTYAESRKKGSNISSSLGHAAIDTAAEVIMEAIPLRFLAHAVGGPILRLISGTLAREVPTEVATTAIQSANARLRDRELTGQPVNWEEYGQDLLDTVGSTMVATPLMAGTAMGMHRIAGKAQPGGGAVGGNNPELLPPTPPPADIETVMPDTGKKAEIDALIASIDAELLDDKAVAAAQATVAKHEELKKSPVNPQAEQLWLPLAAAPKGEVDIGETQLGATVKQAANAPSYVNQNQGDRLDRTFLYGPENAIGLTPRQVAPEAATYTLGVPSEDRSAEYLRAVHDTVEQWRQNYMPDTTLIVSNEGLFSGAALGWHYSMGPKMHMIVPAVIRSPTKGLGAFNANTQASAFYNLSHEFGHALVLEKFYTGMDQGQATKLASQQGVVPEELITQAPAPQAAVIREFNALKQGVLNNTLTAEQFISAWFSPGKLGQKNVLKDLGVAPSDNAAAVVKAIVRRATRKSSIRDEIKQRDLQAKLTADYLSLDEYLAEQMARYAYQAKLDTTSPLGQFFKQALESLRSFFSGLKKDGTIAPGTAFKEWVDGLGNTDRGLTEGERIAKGKQKGGKPAKVAAVAKPPAPRKKKKVQTVQHNVETDTDLAQQQKMSNMVKMLVEEGTVPATAGKRLISLLQQKDYDQFIEEFQPYAAKNVKFELNDTPENARAVLDHLSVLRAGIPEEQANDPKIRAEAAGEWKREQFRSRFFKAWFGDWENDFAGSSKVREGVMALDPATGGETASMTTTGSIQEEFAGAPLVLFHGTKEWGLGAPKGQRSSFEQFSKGDIGFHFGTVRAAHVRLGFEAMPESSFSQDDLELMSLQLQLGVSSLESSYIIPATLNLRNPLYVGSESGYMWQTPRDMIAFLRNRTFISDEEYHKAYNNIERHANNLVGEFGIVGADVRRYEFFAPVRELLVSKGWDGMIYENNVEGDVSFVAFHPNQVKSLLSSRTFSRSDNLHMELDLDAAKPASQGARRLMDGLKNFVSDFPRLRRTLRKVTHAAYHTLELQQLAHINPDVEELQFMHGKNGEYNRYKSRLQAQADAVLNDWNQLGKENWHKLNKFMIAEAESKQLWWDLAKTKVNREGQQADWYEYSPNATTAQKAKEFGLDEELSDLAWRAKNVLLSQLNEAEHALLSVLAKRYANASQDVLVASFIPVKKQIHALRKYPFFPQGRFGNRMLIVEKKKADGPGYEIVWREHFEDAAKWEQAWKEAVAKAAPDERVRKEELSDQHYVLIALPTDFIDMAASELGLSDEQLETLMNILQPVKRDKVLGAYDQQRLGIKGYSSDAMRSFANFTWHNSNLLAKLIYRSDFNLAIRGVGATLREAKYSTDPESLKAVERLQRIKSYMEKTRDYIMAPPNEAQMLRAGVSIMYLGLNVKTALINTYGLITTWSDLTSRLGQVEGSKLFLKASLETFKSIKFTNLNERRPGMYLPADKQKALDQALEEGVLSQSYAYHLAGMANAGNLYRLPAKQLVGRMGQHAIDAAMYIFRLTELSTRRASFLAEFEAASKETLPPLKTAYDVAVERTNKLQNDYSLGNRVPFMRGFKAGETNILGKLFEPAIPLATVFMSFAQHMAFHTYGGYELGERRAAKLAEESPRSIWGGYTMKLWILTLLMAGYEGLPGAENLLDLIEVAWRKWGGAKPMRQELREMVQELEVDPQLVARGLGHNIAGFDVSRSIGFGRMVPGTDVLAHPRDSAAEQFGLLMLDLAGPTGGFLKFGLEAIGSNKPKSEVFKQLPGGAGNIYTAYRWSQEGVRAPTGAEVTHDLETGQLRDLTAAEIAGKFLGFNPAVVSQNREIRFNQYDRKVYWQTRRQMLMDDIWRARWQKDREAEADARKAVAEYNAGVPMEYRQLRITGIDIVKSMQARQKIKRADEQQTTPQRRYRGLYEDVKGSYETP